MPRQQDLCLQEGLTSDDDDRLYDHSLLTSKLDDRTVNRGFSPEAQPLLLEIIGSQQSSA